MSHHQDIYTRAPVQGLLVAETTALTQQLQRHGGTRALLISAMMDDRPPDLPLFGNWARLYVEANHYTGDVRARGDEALPFLDDAFDLVLVRHALEVSSLPRVVVEEASRVLSPGGLLALTGLHPCSAWLPWAMWQARGRPFAMYWPWRLVRWARQAALEVDRVERVGSCWPRHDAGADAPSHALGGGYVLLAHKRRSMAVPIRLKPKAVTAPANARLASGVRRHAAS